MFATAFAGVGVVNILPDDILRGDDLQCPDNFFANLRHGISTLRAHQSLALQTMLHLLGGDPFRNGIQGIFVLLVPLVRCNNNCGVLLRFGLSKDFRFVKQEAQLLHESIFTLFGRCAELLMPGKTQGFHEHIHTTFQLRDFLSLSLKFLIFRPGNRHRIRVPCLQIIFLFHELILPYFLGKVQ